MAKILVIEDDDQNRQLFRAILEGAGYGVIEARDGKKGMSLVRVLAVDLVLTDILMPEMDGLECIMALKKEFPHLKIIAISGEMSNTHLDLLSLAKKLGVCRTIAKPFELAILLHAVEEELPLENLSLFDEF